MTSKLIFILFFGTVVTMNAQHLKLETQNGYLALGDSYTIGESVAEAERWPNQFADSIRRKGLSIEAPTIIATTGWRTDDLNKAILNSQLRKQYSLVSLLIGVNNQFQGKPADQYAIEFEDLLATAVRLAGGKTQNVFVLSIPDYGYTPFGKSKQSSISVALDEFNAINKRISAKLNVRYINITDITRKGLEQPDLVASDGLHPSGKMYALWAARIMKEFAR